MTDQSTDNQVLSNRLHTLRRWGISWSLIGFLMLLQEAFHLEGALWTMILVVVAWVVIPGPSRTTSRLRGMLELAAIILAFVIVLIGSIYLGNLIGVNTGLLLGIVSTGLGVAFQAWAELRGTRNSPGSGTGSGPENGQANPLVDKIRKL